MALDNNEIYSTLVSIVSALENNDKKNNLLIYYMLLSYDFNKLNIKIFEDLKKKYEVKFNYYIIPPIFNSLTQWHYSHSVYYKLLFPIIHPELKRIIYLDGDTLIFKDLLELYNLPFNNNYILGAPSPIHSFPQNFTKNSTIYVNIGVSLINIEKIIKDNKIFNFLDFLMKNTNSFYLLEQDSILYYFSPNIGYLPYKYGMFLIDINNYKNLNFQKKYNLTEISNAINDPSIIHLVFCDPKVWTPKTKSIFSIPHICQIYQQKFYFYAKKTNYYSKIFNYYMSKKNL